MTHSIELSTHDQIRKDITLTQGKLKSDENEAALFWIDDLPLNECEQQLI